MAIEQSYCSTCQARTGWLESVSAWSCLCCGKLTLKRPLAAALAELEALQERWSQLEKHLSLEQNAIVEPLKNDIDRTLSRQLRKHRQVVEFTA